MLITVQPGGGDDDGVSSAMSDGFGGGDELSGLSGEESLHTASGSDVTVIVRRGEEEEKKGNRVSGEVREVPEATKKEPSEERQLLKPSVVEEAGFGSGGGECSGTISMVSVTEMSEEVDSVEEELENSEDEYTLFEESGDN